MNLIHNTLIVEPYKMSSYQNGWGVRCQCSLRGPTPASGELQVELKHSDGSPWCTLTTGIRELDEDETTNVDVFGHEAEQLTDTVGVFPFSIRVVSELDGIDELLFEGTLAVEQTDGHFSSRYDWLLPKGELWLDTYRDSDAPPLTASFWLAGAFNAVDLGAYLFHNGKRIASSETSECQISSGRQIRATTDGNSFGGYNELIVQFNLVKGYLNGEYMDMEQWHMLCDHPGDYEIKIAKERKPIRSIKFRVSEDGMISQTGSITRGIHDIHKMSVDVAILDKAERDVDQLETTRSTHYGTPQPEGQEAISSMYAAWQKAEVISEPNSDLDDATRDELEAVLGKATNIHNWYYDDMVLAPARPGHEFDPSQCELAVMYVSELRPRFSQLIAELGGNRTVEFQGEQTMLEQVWRGLQEISKGAKRGLNAQAEDQNASLAPYRTLLRNDKLRLFEDRPATEYRYYTSGKKVIETPEELAAANTWYFEGTENQGYINERWRVIGWRFDADMNIAETIEESDFGQNAPASAFK